jgi:mRNA-degrading endonuclease RelE of RelBE toxin-antitoxin system
MSSFVVYTTSAFERTSKKVLKKDRKADKIIEEVIDTLEKDPYGENNSKIKKLTDIKQNNGMWRIRFGDYRVRYDVIGKDVVLHSIKNRKDSYKNKR